MFQRLQDEEQESGYNNYNTIGGVSVHTLIVHYGDDELKESVLDGDSKPIKNDKDLLIMMRAREGLDAIDIYVDRDETATPLLFKMPEDQPSFSICGKFDHADKMFSDIGATWNGVLEDMSDVKELVPELFYLPEVLTNENSIDFGTTHLGENLGFVRLPPWAENPVEFVHKHRMALESEHVSEHLHAWIDLVFGLVCRRT